MAKTLLDIAILFFVRRIYVEISAYIRTFQLLTFDFRLSIFNSQKVADGKTPSATERKI